MTYRRVDVEGVDTFVQDLGGGGTATVCLHGNPDSGDLWSPLLSRADRLGRVVAPDIPGWGRSPAPDRAVCDGSVAALDRWFEALLDVLRIDRFNLVVHDWGGLALAAAARRSDRIERLVVLDAVPLSDSYRWHFVARHVWRRRVVGELAAPLHFRWVVALAARLQHPGLRGPHREWRRQLGTSLQRGTVDSILRLYRSAEPAELGRLGSGLPDISSPALFIRGSADPYIRADDMGRLAGRLSGPVEHWEVPGAGHWSMYDDPRVFERVLDFLTPAAAV